MLHRPNALNAELPETKASLGYQLILLCIRICTLSLMGNISFPVVKMILGLVKLQQPMRDSFVFKNKSITYSQLPAKQTNPKQKLQHEK